MAGEKGVMPGVMGPPTGPGVPGYRVAVAGGRTALKFMLLPPGDIGTGL